MLWLICERMMICDVYKAGALMLGGLRGRKLKDGA